jgi:hypothetical protein
VDELITDAQAELLVAAVAAGLLFMGGGAWAVLRGRWIHRVGRRGALLGVAAGPVLYLLWRLDSLLIVWMGFDTLLRVGVELAIFAALGVGIGLWLRGERRAEG